MGYGYRRNNPWGKLRLGRNCYIAKNVSIAVKDGGATILDDGVYIVDGSIVMGSFNVGGECQYRGIILS